MNDLIRSVLELPPGSPWPPDHRALLGLSDTDTTPAIVEAAVLQRMERLRNYQLAHPDEVTDAMNRLARALVELSRPTAVVHVAANVLTLVPEPPAIITEAERVVVSAVESLPVLDLLPESQAPAPQDLIVRLPFQELRHQARPPALPPTWLETTPRYQLQNELTPPPRTDTIASRPALSPRRASVRNVVRHRQLLRAWDAAGTFLAQPEIVAMTRAESVGVLLALGEIESTSWALHENQPGGVVLRLARGRPNVGTLWDLPHTERELLRDDWCNGRLRLVAKYQRVRRAFNRRRPTRNWRQFWTRSRRYAPHATLVAASIAAFIIGLARMAM